MEYLDGDLPAEDHVVRNFLFKHFGLIAVRSKSFLENVQWTTPRARSRTRR